MVNLDVEAWIWYGVAMSVIVARFTARFLQLKSLKKFQLEDAIMFLIIILYTFLILLLIRFNTQPTNLIRPEELDNLSDMDIDDRILGSKLIVVLEQICCAIQWGCKACLLLLYANLTIGLRQHMMVKVVAVYTAISYVVMVIFYFGVWCRPFHNYWSVPAASPQCSTAINHLIFNFVVNVSSDILILMIPLPLLVRTNLPWRKKLILCCLFSVGIFVIVSAILNKYSSFRDQYSNEWVYWYTREISTATIVANLPHGWALVRRAFNLRSFMQSDDSGETIFAARARGRGNPMTIEGQGVPRSRRGSNMSDITRALYAMRNTPKSRGDEDSVEALGGRPRDAPPFDAWDSPETTFSGPQEQETQKRDESPSPRVRNGATTPPPNHKTAADVKEVDETPTASPSSSGRSTITDR